MSSSSAALSRPGNYQTLNSSEIMSDSEFADNTILKRAHSMPNGKLFKNTFYDIESYNNLPSESVPGMTKQEAKQTKLIIVTGLMLLFQFANRVMYKLTTYSMYNYSLYLNLLTCTVYIPIFFSYVVPMAYMGKIRPEEMDFSITQFAFIGFLELRYLLLEASYTCDFYYLSNFSKLAIPHPKQDQNSHQNLHP